MERAIVAMDKAAADGAKLLVFGEIYLNGYETGALGHKYVVAERDDDPWVEQLIEEAQARDVHILMGATTHKGMYPGDLYNSVLVIGPSGLVGVYSKTHVAAFNVRRRAGRRRRERRKPQPGVVWPLQRLAHAVETTASRICYDMKILEVALYASCSREPELIVNVLEPARAASSR